MTTARRPRSMGRLAKHLRTAERRFLLAELVKHQGHAGHVADAIGISRRGLFDKLEDYGLQERAIQLRTQHKIQGPRGRRR